MQPVNSLLIDFPKRRELGRQEGFVRMKIPATAQILNATFHCDQHLLVLPESTKQTQMRRLIYVQNVQGAADGCVRLRLPITVELLAWRLFTGEVHALKNEDIQTHLRFNART